jgi:hypothetical protein
LRLLNHLLQILLHDDIAFRRRLTGSKQRKYNDEQYGSRFLHGKFPPGLMR